VTHSHGSHGSQEAVNWEILEQRIARLENEQRVRYGVEQTSGQGDGVFSWDEELTGAFPPAARAFEKDMHGGFTEDAETGVVYTGVPGAGLFAISPDLKTWRQLGTDKQLKDNIHGIVWFKHAGKKLLAVAQNTTEQVLIIDPADGTVLQRLGSPRGGEFSFGEANRYYSALRHANQANTFACTDVTYLDGKLYVVTGYCDGDFVLTAEPTCCGEWQWGPVAWGGKGNAAGQFETAHGVFAHEGHIYVANREAFQVIKFSPEGHLIEILPDIPHGSRICNVAHAKHNNYFVMNSLAPIPHTAPKTAPIYAHTGERLVSTIDPGSLGIPVLKHLHHVWPHYVVGENGDRTLYLLLHGWRDGKFAVLKHCE